MKNLLIVLIVALALGASSAEARKLRRLKPVHEAPAVHLESWYLSFGLGGAGVHYDDNLDILTQALEASGHSRSSAFFDLGIYFPTGNHGVIGVVATGAGDVFKKGDYEFSITQVLIGPSVRHYFGRYVGRGFYLRGDGGIARLVLDSTDLADPQSTDWGYGIFGGLGYSFEIVRGTRLSLDGGYTMKHIEGEDHGALLVGLSLML